MIWMNGHIVSKTYFSFTSFTISSPDPKQQQRQQQQLKVTHATVPQLTLWLRWWMLQPLPRRWTWPRGRRASMNGMICLRQLQLGEHPASPNSSNRRQKDDPCSHHMVLCLCQEVSRIQLTLRALASGLRIRALKPQSPVSKRSFGLVERQLSQPLTSLMSSSHGR